MNYKVLVIDDDKELCALIKKYGEQENYMVQTAFSGSQGLKKLEADIYHLVILDIMLPEISGFSVLSEIRKTKATPVLMLTAKDAEADKVKGLKLGADDYLTKPFGMNELMARIESLIRRYTLLNQSIPHNKPLIELRGMTIDAENRSVYINDLIIDLTAKEFDLLYFLATSKGKIFTKKQIYTQVWNDEYAFDDNNIMSFISKLRKKIETNPDNPAYILTVRGVGYRFNGEA
jgi:DNA-binding response OmpR family regulator